MSSLRRWITIIGLSLAIASGGAATVEAHPHPDDALRPAASRLAQGERGARGGERGLGERGQPGVRERGQRVRVAQRPDRPRRPARPGKDKRDKVKQRIRVMRALVLAEELQLDEATAGKLAPILARFDDEMEKLLTERAALRAELRDAADAGDEGRLDKLIDRLVANQDGRWNTERKRFADLRRLLSARQAARLLDVLPEIDRRIMRGLRDQLAPRRPGRAMRGRVREPTPLPDGTPEIR